MTFRRLGVWMRLKVLTTIGAVGLAALCGAATGAEPLPPFENGSFEDIVNHWSVDHDHIGVVTHWNHLAAPPPGQENGPPDHTFHPRDGLLFARLIAQEDGSLTTASQSFSTSGGWLSGWAAFLGEDDVGLDTGYVRVIPLSGIGASPLVLFQSTNTAVGGYGWTPWKRFSTFLTPGEYRVEAAIFEDDAFEQSFLLVDGFQITAANPIPEPATWALMIGGFFGAGAGLRRRRAGVA